MYQPGKDGFSRRTYVLHIHLHKLDNILQARTPAASVVGDVPGAPLSLSLSMCHRSYSTKLGMSLRFLPNKKRNRALASHRLWMIAHQTKLVPCRIQCHGFGKHPLAPRTAGANVISSPPPSPLPPQLLETHQQQDGAELK